MSRRGEGGIVEQETISDLRQGMHRQNHVLFLCKVLQKQIKAIFLICAEIFQLPTDRQGFREALPGYGGLV